MRKKQRIKFVNNLKITQGKDGIFRVRTIKKPYTILKEAPTFQKAYRWAHQCRDFALKEPPWAPWELDFLSDNYGRISVDEICRILHRSPNAQKIKAYRKFRMNQKTNIYTARELARELGISCAKIIVAWHTRGYLKGKLAPFKNGPNNVWFFDYDDIITCLQQRPWLCKLKKMPQSYFRSVVQREWEKDPWYSKDEAGKFLGLADGNPVYRYIKEGWLPAIRAPMGGSKGAWILRHSDLAEFQLHDPRPLHRKSATLAETVDHELKRAEKRAWRQLARGRFQMFGHWASIHQHLASTVSRNHKSPFKRLIEVAKEVMNEEAGKARN